jgi:cation diffusion facilitator CzcD-associated flavoprotein CzcO
MSYQLFDAVVVASGHYHAPKVPNTPGLADWKRWWPERVQHSKRYRSPEAADGKVSPAYSTDLSIALLAKAHTL